MEVPHSHRCNLIRTMPDCMDNGGTLLSMEYIFCYCGERSEAYGMALLTLIELSLFLLVGIIADDLICPCVSAISRVLKISDNLAGVTILAFGNGCPDVFSSLAAQYSNHSEVLYSGLIGASLVVSIFLGGFILCVRPFLVKGWHFARDIIFLIIANSYFFAIFHSGRMVIAHAIGFLVIYAVYIIAVLMNIIIDALTRRKMKLEQEKKMEKDATEDSPTNRRKSQSIVRRWSGTTVKLELAKEHERRSSRIGAEVIQKEEHDERLYEESGESGWKYLFIDFWNRISPGRLDSWKSLTGIISNLIIIFTFPIGFVLAIVNPVVDHTAIHNGWCKLLVMLNCIFGPPVLFVVAGGGNLHIKGYPVWPFMFLLGLVGCVLVFFLTSPGKIPRGHNVLAFFGFAASAILINFLTKLIIDVLRTMGTWFKLTNSTLGFTILAWGNSIGDIIANLALARQGYQRMAFAACFGGPLFNCLFGAGLTISTSMIKQGIYTNEANYGTKGPTGSLFLMIALVSILIFLPTMDFEGRSCLGQYLIILYITFFIFMFCTEFDYLHQFGHVADQLQPK